jgi:cysteine synthase
MVLQPSTVVDTVLDTIGNTPVVRLDRVVPKDHGQVFLKLEWFNPTGSYKDRMAKSMIEEAERRGNLRPGMTVVEATAGSTGSSLAMVSAVKGYKFHVVSSNAFAVEKLRTIRAFGATLDLIESPSGMITANLIPSMRAHARDLTRDSNYYYCDQFTNKDALIGYETIGHELIKQFPQGIDFFCGAVGTAGMIMGVGRVLKSKWPACRVVALEPKSSPIITQGHAGDHRVEGVSVGFLPPLLDRQLIDEVRTVSEEDARSMCKRLAREEGLLVGTSTGLNVAAARELATEAGSDKIIVTIAVDTGLKYLNGDLFTEN